MALYRYLAVDGAAREVRGTIAADTPRDARERLRAQGYTVESLAQPAAAAAGWWRLPVLKGRYAGPLAGLVRDLATLLASGIGLVEALDTLAGQCRGRLHLSLLGLRQRVASGSSLSEAMQADPAVYDELTIQMVRVGENAGTLDVVLDRLADFRERYLLLKDRITTALVYPSIVVAMAVGVSAFLMTVVLPMLLENLVAAGRPLPWPTRMLKAASDVAVAGRVALVRGAEPGCHLALPVLPGMWILLAMLETLETYTLSELRELPRLALDLPDPLPP